MRYDIYDNDDCDACKKSDTGSLYASENVSARNLDSYEFVDLSLFMLPHCLQSFLCSYLDDS